MNGLSVSGGGESLLSDIQKVWVVEACADLAVGLEWFSDG